jgi:hypothetical protein
MAAECKSGMQLDRSRVGVAESRIYDVLDDSTADVLLLI